MQIMTNNLITPKEFYKYLCKNGKGTIGINTVYRMIRRKDFPALKIGKRFYIIENKIDEWLNKQAEKFWC